MERATFRRIIGVAVVAAAVGLAVPSVAGANPACGQTVTRNITLTRNMDCSMSSSDGLVIGKAGITIDLKGHTLTGPVTNSYSGIDNRNGYNRVTVENGTISNYEDGVFDSGTNGSKILNITSVDPSYAGIAFRYSNNGLINRSKVSGSSDYGFYLYENTRVNLTNSKAVNDGSDGVYDYFSLATIYNVTSNANTGAGGGFGFNIEYPIAAYTPNGTDYYTVENSTANHNRSDGFYIEGNAPSLYYQAMMLDNVANSNGEWGLAADAWTKGKGNDGTGNTSGNCLRVPCG